MSARATITNRGAVLLEKHAACGAFDEFKQVRVVIHAHVDHMIYLRQSLRKCEGVLMTGATMDLIEVMMDPLFLMGGFVEMLDYGKSFQYEGERITLFLADHILGAAQVLVEDAEGTRIVYTGDFRVEGTLVLDADVLVMEATYGSPAYKRSFDKDVKNLLVSLVEERLKRGSVYVFGYHGKLQEVMQTLHEAGVRTPFVVPERVFRVSRVCERHGMRLGPLMLSEEKEAKELLERNAPCIAFYHMGSRGKVGLGGSSFPSLFSPFSLFYLRW